jgi:PAP2 superfamily protein
MLIRFRIPAVLLFSVVFGSPLVAQNVVTDWTITAMQTVVINGKKTPPAFAVWYAYSAIATYDAVNAIEQRYQPFYYSTPAPAGASEKAAAAAAAHRVLVHYFAEQQPALDDAFAASLARIDDPHGYIDAGIKVGEAAADAVIDARANDGLEANVIYTVGSGPGVWQPTAPAPPVTPWLGAMQPFSTKRASQFLPGPPLSLSSDGWVSNYNIVRELGSATSTSRTPGETEIAFFWTEHPGTQYARAFVALAEYYQLNVLETSRMMALLWTGLADAGVGCFNAKYTYSFWRPVTAIHAGGDNPSLTADPSWTPLGKTPNHPEYPSAHTCITGAVATLMADYFSTTAVHIVVDSNVFTDGLHTHTFEDTREFFNEVWWARVYIGFHYPHSLDAGGDLGKAVGQHLFATKFRRPVLPHTDRRALAAN